MKKVYLELTNRCNLNCIMCYRKAWHEGYSDMEEDLLEKVVSEIKNQDSVEEVVLGGIGEPVYSRGIGYVMEALKDKRLVITTNGTIMSDRLIKQFIHCVDELVISVDGLEESFQAMRDFPLQGILSNISKLNEAKKTAKSRLPRVSFQMVITKDNYKELAKVVELASDYDVDQVIFSNVIPADLEDADLAMYEMYSKEPLQKDLQKAVMKGLIKNVDIRVPEIMLKTERRCRFIEDDATMVTVTGHVVPCYRLAHDGKEVVFGREKELKAHSFGHIGDRTLQEIWQQEDYVHYRQAVFNNLYPSCPDCDLLDGCDMVKLSEMDCYGNTPSCSDCLWSRGIVYCV